MSQDYVAETTTRAGRFPVLNGDRRGYLLGRDRVDGFADRADLPDGARYRIARWAVQFTPDAATEDQRKLAHDFPRSARAHRQTRHLGGALRDAAVEARNADVGLDGLLTDEQSALVRAPGAHPELHGRDYPLTTRDVAKLVGATERQVRHWADLGLLDAQRVGLARTFMPASVARAFALADSTPQEKSALAALVTSAANGRRLLTLAVAALDDLAERSPDTAAASDARRARDAIARHDDAVGPRASR